MSNFILSKVQIDECVACLSHPQYAEGISPSDAIWDILEDVLEVNERIALSRESDNGIRTALGRLLWGMNLEACQVRYPQDKSGNRPGPIDFADKDVEMYRYAEPQESNLHVLLTVVDTLLYNSVEAATVLNKAIWTRTKMAQGRIAMNIIRALVEHEESPDTPTFGRCHSRWLPASLTNGGVGI